MKIKWLGQAGFKLDNELLIDPWAEDNPSYQFTKEDRKAKYVCITHDHFDHIGGAYALAKEANAKCVAIHELAEDMADNGLETEGINIGGTIQLDEWKITMVQAFHSCTLGVPVGYVLEKNNFKVYHAGDTGFFRDMEEIGKLNIDLALLPIGGRYTMDEKEAVKAITVLKPKNVIPMHYNTFPLIKADANAFKEMTEKEGTKATILLPGNEIELR